MITLSPSLQVQAQDPDGASTAAASAQSTAGKGGVERAGAPARQGFERTLECDICVVGADLAGLLIACDLASRGYDVSLVRLPEEEPGGFDSALAPGFALPATELLAHVGREDASELLGLSAGAAEKGMAYATQAGLALGPRGRLAVARAHAAAALRVEQKTREELAPHSTLLLNAQDTQALLGTSAYAAALGVVPAQRVDVAGLRAVLMEAARASEVRVLNGAPGMVVEPHGLRKHVYAGKLRVRSAIVVFSGGLSICGIAPALRPNLIPTPCVRGHFVLPENEDGYQGLAEEVGSTGLRFYRAGGALHISAETAWQAWSASGAARALCRDARALSPDVAGLAPQNPRALMLARTREQMPLVQEGEPGVWYCATLGDEEPAYGVMAADLIVGAIAERDDRVRLLQPFGLASAGQRPASRFGTIVSYGYARLSRMFMPKVAPASAPPRALPPPASSRQAEVSSEDGMDGSRR